MYQIWLWILTESNYIVLLLLFWFSFQLHHSFLSFNTFFQRIVELIQPSMEKRSNQPEPISKKIELIWILSFNTSITSRIIWMFIWILINTNFFLIMRVKWRNETFFPEWSYIRSEWHSRSFTNSISFLNQYDMFSTSLYKWRVFH